MQDYSEIEIPTKKQLAWPPLFIVFWRMFAVLTAMVARRLMAISRLPCRGGHVSTKSMYAERLRKEIKEPSGTKIISDRLGNVCVIAHSCSSFGVS